MVGENVAAGTLPGSGGDGTLTFGFGTNVAPAGFTYDTSVANTLLIKQGGTTVITITINPTTGAYSVTQNNPIHHDAGADENNQTFAIDYTVKDIDLDTAHGTINLNVDDDSPVAAMVTTGQAVSVDETAGVQGDSNDTTNAGVDRPVRRRREQGCRSGHGRPSSGRTPVHRLPRPAARYGADGAGTTVFGLKQSAPGGVDSGLDTTSGVSIFLFKEGSLIVGRVGARRRRRVRGVRHRDRSVDRRGQHGRVSLDPAHQHRQRQMSRRRSPMARSRRP